MIRFFSITISIVILYTTVAIPMAYAQTTTSSTLLDKVTKELSAPANTTSGGGFSQNGLFGCSGAKYGAVGAQGPVGAVVPVFDSAVFDQQRLLTYKECLLNGIAIAQRQALIASMVKNTTEWAQKGVDGKPVFVTNLGKQRLAVSDNAHTQFINGPEINQILPEYRQSVQRALDVQYANDTRKQPNSLRCPLSTAQLNALRNSTADIQTMYLSAVNPACSPYGAYTIANSLHGQAVSQALIDNATLLSYGNGFLSPTKTKTIDVGGQKVTQTSIVTPGYLIAQQLSQVLGTGLRQLENATQIDGIISSSLANIGTQMLTDIGGFSGLTASLGGQPSYVSRLATNTAAAARNKMVGAAAGVLSNTIRVEKTYWTTRSTAVASVSQTQTQLRSWENTCWSGMSDKAQTAMEDKVKSAVCPQSVGTTTPACGTPITLSKKYASDVIVIHTPTPQSVQATGYLSKNDSTLQLLITDSTATTSTKIKVTIANDGSWSSDSFSTKAFPDGTITLQTTETLARGAGSISNTAIVEKTVTATGSTLTIPTVLPKITVTAKAGGNTASVILVPDTTHSQILIDSDITPVLAILQENVNRSSKALAVLLQMQNILASTTSVNAQRAILKRMDALVAQRVLHSESDVRKAESQNTEIDRAMQQLQKNTKTTWEAGWCRPSNWADHTQ